MFKTPNLIRKKNAMLL